VVPCHRVVGKNGALVGYGGGLDLKEALLQLEGVGVKDRRIIADESWMKNH
jgi:alkylated DNA nucleotide flippase Atl1